MSGDHLVRVRWGVRGAMVLGVATSVAANVLHAEPNPISQAIAAWPPLALLLTVELISRVPVYRKSLAVVRLAATACIAGIAAWVSYWHMAGVASRYGEQGAAPFLIPLSVDGLIVVASVCLVELSGRIREAEMPVPVTAERAQVSPEALDIPADIEPDTRRDIDTDKAPAPAADPEDSDSEATQEATSQRQDSPEPETEDVAVKGEPDVEPDTARPRPLASRKRKRDTATAVTRLRTRHPEMTAVEIARRVGVSDRTVRRHLRTPVTADAA